MVVRGKNEIKCTFNLATLVVVGSKVRLGKWVFVVKEVKDNNKLLVRRC